MATPGMVPALFWGAGPASGPFGSGSAVPDRSWIGPRSRPTRLLRSDRPVPAVPHAGRPIRACMRSRAGSVVPDWVCTSMRAAAASRSAPVGRRKTPDGTFSTVPRTMPWVLSVSTSPRAVTVSVSNGPCREKLVTMFPKASFLVSTWQSASTSTVQSPHIVPVEIPRRQPQYLKDSKRWLFIGEGFGVGEGKAHGASLYRSGRQRPERPGHQKRYCSAIAPPSALLRLMNPSTNSCNPAWKIASTSRLRKSLWIDRAMRCALPWRP